MMIVQGSRPYDIVKHLLFLVIVILSYACGGGDEAAQPTIATVYVNAQNGNDSTGDGSPDWPFHTITKGISVAQEHYTVRVSPGTYDEVLGEMFPIQLKPNVAVKGDVSNKGEGSPPTVIEGVGSYSSPSLGTAFNVAVVCEAGGTLKGFIIRAANGVATWCEGDFDNMIISANTINYSDYGIVVSGTAQPLVIDNIISDNAISGIETFVSSAPKIRGNAITNNSFGVTIRNFSQSNLGTAIDFGNNTLINNVNCDLHNQTTNKILAIGNVWDEDPFLFNASSTCSDGTNIANVAGGAVDYQYVPFGNKVFPGSIEITLVMPEKGAMLFTNEPGFRWISIGNKLVSLEIFSKPMIVQNNKIKNEVDLVWAWHSGLTTGREGDVSFYDGRNVIDGDLDNTTLPTPLEKGRSYYWAVWAWDDDGVRITHSSIESYFTIAN